MKYHQFILGFSVSLFSVTFCDNVANTFSYFAYGSNLLAKRIHINNPTAVRKGVAKLEDYRLDFDYHSKRWNGCVATIVPDKGKHVYGALWEINNEDMANLDAQEGVHTHVYEVINVSVKTLPEGTKVESRSYQLSQPPPSVPEGEPFPNERRPSKSYLETIIGGARESGLPTEYITFLESFPHNGLTGVPSSLVKISNKNKK